VLTLEGEKQQVSCLAASPNQKNLAVGYSDGSIRVFDLTKGELAITFTGHKSAVSALNYDLQGMRLVSGSMVRTCLLKSDNKLVGILHQDTEVIVWDIVNEAGMFRLRGHKGVVTQAKFLQTKDVLITR
jgi:U3 small nucleolar RNA-associated protein 12